MTVAARESGVGEAASPTGAAAAAARVVTNEPVTTPVAKAGRVDGASTDRPSAIGEHHGVTDVGREADGGRDHAEDEEQRGGLCHVVSRDAGGPAGGSAGPWDRRRRSAGCSSAAQAAARPPGGGPAGRRERVVGVSVNERPQLPQVSSVAGRTSEHLGHATTRVSPDGERVMPGS